MNISITEYEPGNGVAEENIVRRHVQTHEWVVLPHRHAWRAPVLATKLF